MHWPFEHAVLGEHTCLTEPSQLRTSCRSSEQLGPQSDMLVLPPSCVGFRLMPASVTTACPSSLPLSVPPSKMPAQYGSQTSHDGETVSSWSAPGSPRVSDRMLFIAIMLPMHGPQFSPSHVIFPTEHV